VDKEGVVNFIVSGNMFAYPKEKKEWDKAIERDFFTRGYGEGDFKKGGA
jgi:hypothetical protein